MLPAPTARVRRCVGGRGRLGGTTGAAGVPQPWAARPTAPRQPPEHQAGGTRGRPARNASAPTASAGAATPYAPRGRAQVARAPGRGHAAASRHAAAGERDRHPTARGPARRGGGRQRDGREGPAAAQSTHHAHTWRAEARADGAPAAGTPPSSHPHEDKTMEKKQKKTASRSATTTTHRYRQGQSETTTKKPPPRLADRGPRPPRQPRQPATQKKETRRRRPPVRWSPPPHAPQHDATPDRQWHHQPTKRRGRRLVEEPRMGRGEPMTGCVGGAGARPRRRDREACRQRRGRRRGRTQWVWRRDATARGARIRFRAEPLQPEAAGRRECCGGTWHRSRRQLHQYVYDVRTLLQL